MIESNLHMGGRYSNHNFDQFKPMKCDTSDTMLLVLLFTELYRAEQFYPYKITTCAWQ